MSFSKPKRRSDIFFSDLDEIFSICSSDYQDEQQIFDVLSSEFFIPNNTNMDGGQTVLPKSEEKDTSLINSQSEQQAQSSSQPFNSSSSLQTNKCQSYSRSTQKSIDILSDNQYQKGKRRPKGFNPGGQYPTNNLQPTIKGIFHKLIIEKKGQQFIKNDPVLSRLFDHADATRREFLTIYRHPDLKELLEEVFQRKVLFRKLMETKTRPKNKVEYMKYLDTFEYAYWTGSLPKLTVVKSEELRMLKLQMKERRRMMGQDEEQ